MNKKGKKKHLLYISGFFGWGSPHGINISFFNSYYQNSKNQEKNINLVVAETGEVALLSFVQAFPGSQLARNIG